MQSISGLPQKTYSQFHNESDTPQGNIEAQQPQISAEEQKKVAENVQRTKKLAIVEMVVSIIVLFCGITATTVAAADLPPWYFYGGVNVAGTNIWAPVLGIITAGLGLGALKYGDYSRGCLLIAHFVMCIISAKAFGLLIIFTSICLADSREYSYASYYYHYYSDGPLAVATGFVIAAQSFVLIGALINFISFIVSSAFICQYWCGRKSNTGTTVVYIPSQISTENGQMQAVAVPVGTQVIFIQSNNVPQNQNPVQAVVS